jgi:TolB-like protein/Tfp pilus assembly protein PilF
VTDVTEGENDSAWTRLRRRKVVQWGLIYTAAAWGFLQGLEYVSATYDWPRHIQQYATLAFLIGLPIALVFAWYHGDRGQQRITTPEFAIVTLLLLLGGGVFWYYQRASEAGRTDDARTANSAQRDIPSNVKDARPSIAVLPFDNRSRQADDAFFVDGIHDDILTQLSKVSALRVISRTSVERFRKSGLSVQQIAQQLGVRSILEGGVQRAGDRVRINVQLIDATTDAHVWAETYDRELIAANIFAIQSELAAAIAGELRASLTPDEQARVKRVPTQNLEAWEAYQLGRQRMASRTTARLAQAKSYFSKAVALDPGFALAHVGLSDTAILQYGYAGTPLNVALAAAEQSADRALQIDRNLAEAWVSMASIAETRMQYDRAEKMYRRAIELNPNYATAHQWFANVLVIQNRLDESLAHLQTAANLDPLSGIIQNALGQTFEAAGRFEEAEHRYQKAIEVDPDMASPYVSLGNLFGLAHGRVDLAIPYLEKAAALDPGCPTCLASLAEAYRLIGDRRQALLWLERARTAGPDDDAVHAVAAMFAYEAGDHTAGHAHAVKAAANPLLMNPLRIDDLGNGKVAAARARYADAYPELLADNPTVNLANLNAAIDLALVLQRTGERARASDLLDSCEEAISHIPRMGTFGYGLSDVAIYALRGDKAQALVKLREARKAGWPIPYQRDFDPNFEFIRDDPEFKAIFADASRDLAQQGARLAARPKDAPLEPTAGSR